MNQSDMRQDIRETLSAGVDGELSSEQLRFLLRRLDHDVTLQQAWSHYHVAGDALRQQLPILASAGFSARVLQAIERKQASTVVRRGGRWLRWSAGGAIAASVAAVALMVAQPAGEADRSAVLSASLQKPANSAAPTAGPANESPSPAAVPPWLSGNSAGMLSEQAAATFGAPLGQGHSGNAYTRNLPGYSGTHRYRTLNNRDGSYLLLLDQQQKRPALSQPPAGVIAQ